MGKQIEQFENSLLHAFPIKIPRDQVLTEMHCDDPDYQRICNVYGCRTWQQLDQAEVLEYPELLVFLSPSAFAYFLPGLMMIAMRSLDSTFIESMIMNIVADKSSPFTAQKIAKIEKLLDSNQAKVKERFLAGLSEINPYYSMLIDK